MSKKNSIPNGVVMPFAEKFSETWEIWKEYKSEAYGFKYKGCISEQMAIKHVVELSDGEEDKAIKIIEQSIRRLWQGFFPLKETTHGTKQATLRAIKSTNDNLTDRVQSEANKRYGNG